MYRKCDFWRDMHSHTLSAGVEPLHDGVLLGRLLLLGEEVGLGDVVRQRRFRHVDLLTLVKPLTIETAIGLPDKRLLL